MTETFRIDADVIYDDPTLVLGLGLTQATLARARRDGHLRSTRKGRRVLYRGQWIIDWLEHDSGQDARGGSNG